MVESSADTQSLEELVSKVPGVVGVHSKLVRTDEGGER
jgi:hypothetical protein